MSFENATDAPGIEVRTYFVRGRNALVARADFGELYVDYYLHQGQHGYQHQPLHDAMLKEALAALTLHSASRPWNESWAWTIHFAEPLLNLFVTGDNRRGMIVGQLFTENVKADGIGRFAADMVRERGEPRRSVVEFDGAEVFPGGGAFLRAERAAARAHFPAWAGGLRDDLRAAAVRCGVAGVARRRGGSQAGRDGDAKPAGDAAVSLGMRLFAGADACGARADDAARPGGIVRRGRGAAHLVSALWGTACGDARGAGGLRERGVMMDDFEQRFGGIARLYGKAGLARLRAAHVAVIGLGGVGSWTVEALARSGIGALTLIDLDDICITNVNRQLHAIDGQIGRPKADALADRARAINPACRVEIIAQFFTTATAAELLPLRYDFVVDAIDKLSHKCAVITGCRERGLNVLTVGGAGGRRDGTAVRVADLADSTQDELLRQVRRKLRREFGFPSERGAKFDIPCVYSPERPVFPWADGTCAVEAEPGSNLKLDCATGFGTATFVTGAFGFAAAGEVVRRVAAG